MLEDVESSSNDQESDVDISSDFVMTPSHEPEPESMEDSLELAVPRSIPPQLSTIVNRPISSKAWDWNANDKCENPFVKDVSETNEHKGLPFERYQQAAGENISSDDDKPAATSDINGKLSVYCPTVIPVGTEASGPTSSAQLHLAISLMKYSETCIYECSLRHGLLLKKHCIISKTFAFQ